MRLPLKMENNNVTTTKVEEPDQVIMKDPKKVAAGKTLAESNSGKIEEHEWLAKAQSESKLTYYGAGAIVTIGALAVIGYYIYQ